MRLDTWHIDVDVFSFKLPGFIILVISFIFRKTTDLFNAL